MAVIVNGIELPSTCWMCPLCNETFFVCQATGNEVEDYWDEKIKPNDCPLKEVLTGKWIVKDGREQGYDIGGCKTWYIQIMCDRCGFIKTAIEGHTGQYTYCPHCGCAMNGEEKQDGN